MITYKRWEIFCLIYADTAYEKLKPRASGFGVLHSLCKIYKSLIDNCLPPRRFLSAIKTRSQNSI